MQFLNFSTELWVELGMALSMNLHVFAGISSRHWEWNGSCGIMGIAFAISPAAPLADNGNTRLWPHQKCNQWIGHYTHTSTNTKLNAKLSFCRLSMFLIKSLWFVFWMEIEGVWWVRMILVNDKRNRLNSRASSYPSTFTRFPCYIKTDLRTDQNPKLVKMISA